MVLPKCFGTSLEQTQKDATSNYVCSFKWLLFGWTMLDRWFHLPIILIHSGPWPPQLAPDWHQDMAQRTGLPIHCLKLGFIGCKSLLCLRWCPYSMTCEVFGSAYFLHWHVGSDRILPLRLDTKEITFAGVSTSTEDLLRWQWLREGLSIWQITVRQGLVFVELLGKTWPCWSYLKGIFVAWNASSLYSILQVDGANPIGHSPFGSFWSIQKLNWFNSMGMVRRSCFQHPAPPNPLEKYDFGIFW